MVDSSRKPMDRVLGNNEESVAFSLADRTMGFLNKSGLTSWLNLFFQFKPQATTISITNDESNSFAVTGTGTDQLVPPTGYIPLTGFTMASGSTGNDFVYTAQDELVVPDDGYYDIDGWMSFRHTVNNSTVAVIFGFEFASDPGNIVYSPRPTAMETPRNDRLGLLSGGGAAQLSTGDKITVWIASNNSGTVTCPNATLRIKKYTD